MSPNPYVPYKPLKETVTEEVEVTGITADLVNFYKYVMNIRDVHYGLNDTKLIQLAREFWDIKHGE